MMNTIDI